MKKLFRIIVGCLFVGCLVVLSGFTFQDNYRAFIFKDFKECGVLKRDGSPVIVHADELHVSITVGNHGGNVMLKCQAKGIDVPGEETVLVGSDCGTQLGTGNYQNVISESGNVILTCWIKKEK